MYDIIKLINKKELIHVEEKTVYTTAELADKFQVTRQTLAKWQDKGLPHYKVGRIIRYNINDVEEWLSNYENEGE